MTFSGLFTSPLARARGPSAVLWEHGNRLHLRLRSSASADDPSGQRRIERTLEQEAGVEWARVHARLGCVVIQGTTANLPAERLSAVLDEVERANEGMRAPVATRHPERHPGDFSPLLRTGLEIAVDIASIAGSSILRRLQRNKRPAHIDLAALLEFVSGVPRVRKVVEQVGTIAGTEVALEISRALMQSLLQSEAGPVVATLRRSLKLRELMARRTLWRQLEPDLCSRADTFDTASEARVVRPCPAPKGPIGPYTDKAALGALGVFLASLLSVRDVEAAAGSIFAGIPKPARYGREAFAAHFGYRLARAGVLVVEPHILRRLDRIDCVLVDERLFALDGTRVEVLHDAVRAAGLSLVIARLSQDPLEMMRALQLEGHGVCAIGLGPWAALRAADCGVACWKSDCSPPWSADIICPPGVDAATVLVQGIAVARRVSEQGVALSLAEAAFAGGLAVTGVKKRTTRRIMLAASAASVVSIANGIRHAQALPLLVTSESTLRRVTQAAAPPWHELDSDEVLRRLVSTRTGLSEQQVADRRRPQVRRPSQLSHLGHALMSELKGPMTPVLATAAGLSLATGAVVDAALIASVLAINGAVGGVQQFRSERALNALGQHEAQVCRVLRGGGAMVGVTAESLVPGDIIDLAAGDVVPADCRIVWAEALEADESSLSGESLPVAKYERPVHTEVLAERSSMLYEGSAIAAGRALAVAVAVGEDTEAHQAEAQTKTVVAATGVEARLETLTSMTMPLAAGAGVLLAAAALPRGRPPAEVLASGVGLAVAAIPEGLPLLATMAQLAAAGRLSQRGALVRQPRAVEALGRVNVLCADKTGTLTEGSIRLCLVSDGCESQEASKLGPRHRHVLAAALRASPSTSNGDTIPHLTDRALVAGARLAGVGSHDEFSGWQRIDHLPFESRRGFHAGLAGHDHGTLLSVKGAPEVVLPLCTSWLRREEVVPLSDLLRKRLGEEVAALAGKGYRVLVVAERVANSRGPIDQERLRDFSLCGFVAFADRVRPSARAAVHELGRAGVDVIMVTGDHPNTARTIAAELGIGKGQGVVSGPQLDKLNDAALDKIIADTAVFARVTPVQKVRVVAALQRSGRVVAMTGDGANDAPAIRLADVGIALGAKSTAAARASADMVVTDERIETIVHAILEGRALWASVRDAVSLLVGGNVGEILFTLGAGLIAGESPLNPRQLLFVNLITDTLPALAIALRPPRAKTPEQLLREGPDASLGESLNRDIAWRASMTSVSATAAWLAARCTGGRKGASTVGLVTLTGSQLMQTLVLGGRSKLAIGASVGAFVVVITAVQTPGLSQALGCRPLGPIGLAQAGIATAASTVVAVIHRLQSGRV